MSWDDIPRRKEVVDISAADHTFVIKTITALHNATASGGTVVVQMHGEETASNRYIPAGGSVPGMFAKVVRSGTALTAAGALVGLSPHASDT